MVSNKILPRPFDCRAIDVEQFNGWTGKQKIANTHRQCMLSTRIQKRYRFIEDERRRNEQASLIGYLGPSCMRDLVILICLKD